MANAFTRREATIKRRLERNLASSMRGIFAATARELRVAFMRGVTIDVHGRTKDSMQRLLVAHYRKVFDVFNHAMTDQLTVDLQLTDEESANLQASGEALFAERAELQTLRINRTTQKHVDVAMARARAALSDAGETPSHPMVAALAASMMTSKLAARVGLIARIESQWAAEVSKALELTILLDAEGGIEIRSYSHLQTKARDDLQQVGKTWRSQGDSRVRTEPNSKFDHLDADGQRVMSQELFNVSGELLMWPGDTSNGATMGNIVNCRCSAEYEVAQVSRLRRLLRRPFVRDTERIRQTESSVVVGIDIDDPDFDIPESTIQNFP